MWRREAVLEARATMRCVWMLGVLTIAESVQSTDVQQHSDVHQVRVVEGREARLPCPQLTPLQRDSIALVIWYRNDMQNPIYSFDNRPSRSGRQKHWADVSSLGNSRATYRPTKDQLVLADVSRDDEGRYRCRVDFIGVPTVTGDVQLTVIVPPGAPVIRDEAGTIISNSSWLKLKEGSRLALTCEVQQGFPLPRVRWLVQNATEVVQLGQSELTQHQSVTSRLVLPQLRRADLRSNLTCSAHNNDVTGPVTTTVTLDVLFRPLRVRLEGEAGPLSVGREYEYICRSSGSRPPAVLSWFLDGAALLNVRQHTSPDGSVSRSTLLLRPALGDQGKKLSCRALNPLMVGSPYLQDSRRLEIRFIVRIWKRVRRAQEVQEGSSPECSITINLLDDFRLSKHIDFQNVLFNFSAEEFAPVATLRLSPMIRPDNVREGMGVYFDCIVEANPAPSQVTWLHKGREVEADRQAGVIVSSSSLVLQNVTRHEAGEYHCRALNTEGTSTSNAVHLRVMFAPVCAGGQRTVYGVSRGEQVSVICRVAADPAPFEFSWLLNGSERVRPLGGDSVVQWPDGPHSSSVRVTPQDDRDYGVLLCRSRNKIGHQAKPCQFQIVPAGPPAVLTSCEVGNQTDVSFDLRCTAGFDGGAKQHFSLELYHHQRLELNFSRPRPRFAVTGLSPGVRYTAVVFAANQKGAGPKVSIVVHTQHAAEQRTGKSTQGSIAERRPRVDWTPLVGVVAGAAFAVFACVLAVVLLVRRRGPRPPKSPDKDAAGLPDAEDNNPDVVPSLSDGCSHEDASEARRLTVVRDDCHTELYTSYPLNHVNFASFHGGSLSRSGQVVLPSHDSTTVTNPLTSDRESVV